MGDGTDIQIQEEDWLPVVNSSRVPTPYINNNADLVLADFIDFEHGKWKENRAQATFIENDCSSNI